MQPRRILWSLALSVTACVAGCSGSSSEGVVAGLVTLDGTPLKSGQIHLLSADGTGPTAGAVIVDGRYSVSATPGEKIVQIRAAEDGPARPMYGAAPAKPAAGTAQQQIPARYNDESELKLDVAAGDVEQNFELASK